MKQHRIGIIMNGVTDAWAPTSISSARSIAIIKQGGVRIGADEVIMPDPILVGRNESKLRELCARRPASTRWTTDLDAALADPG